MTAARHPRIACLVPGCRRGSTSFAPGYEVICARCWSRVRPETRRRRARARRELEKWRAIQAARPLDAMAGELKPWFRAHRLEALAWSRAKAEAIQRAAGL